MTSVIQTCRKSRQSGNALVLLLLIGSWEGREEPTRDELAHLANISARQAERHLLKLEEDGEIVVNHARGRGVKTRYSLPVNQTNVSDKDLPEVSDQAPVNLTDVTALSDTSDRLNRDKSDTPDGLRADKSDTFGNPPTPPYKDSIKENITQPSPTAQVGAKAPDVIWGLGVQMLVRSGMRERDARALLGRLAKDGNEERLCQAIASTSRKNPADPQSYLVAACQARPPSRGGSKVEQSMGAVRTRIAELEAKKCQAKTT